MNRPLKVAGVFASLMAILAISGGHWLSLQSIAWARMLVAFSRENPLRIALEKTFDGRHPCSLCVKVQNGWRQEQQEKKQLPLLRLDKMPEALWELRASTLPRVPTPARDKIAFVSAHFVDFIDSPPTPPPRPSRGTL